MVEASIAQHLWTGDPAYVRDEAFLRYYRNALTAFVEEHDPHGTGLAGESGTKDIFLGTPSYNESPRGGGMTLAADGVASQWAALRSVADHHPDAQFAAWAGGPYLDIPFDVDVPVDSIEVRLALDHPDARIDIGLAGPDGWRGWSGSARRRFVVGARAATWGYLPGRVETGTWRLVLGLHVVPAGGVRARVRVVAPGGEAEPDPAPPPLVASSPASANRTLPASPGRAWYAGDFHAHTLHSDGRLSIEQLAALGVERRLDFLAVTDHNTISHHRHLDQTGRRRGIALLPGQEVTTARGHANAFGRIPWVDFRAHPDQWVSRVAEGGGFLSINHPVSGDCSWQWGLRKWPSHAEAVHAGMLEDELSTAPFAWLNSRRHSPPALLGGSDFHGAEISALPGAITTWVEAEEPTVDAILAAAREGRTAIARGTDGPVLLRAHGELVALDADGLVMCDADGQRTVVHGDRVALATAGPGPYRLEGADRRVWAMSS